MPGFRRWHPNEEGFSYAKVWFYYVPCWLVLLGIAVTLISVFGGLQWFNQIGNWFPSSVPLRIAIAVGLIAAYYLFFMKILWRLLPASIRARIPYDAKEASESKGDIKSLSDLRKLVLRPRDQHE
jgi:uncharacterized protein YybS (DUF2232 family)